MAPVADKEPVPLVPKQVLLYNRSTKSLKTGHM